MHSEPYLNRPLLMYFGFEQTYSMEAFMVYGILCWLNSCCALIHHFMLGLEYDFTYTINHWEYWTISNKRINCVFFQVSRGSSIKATPTYWNNHCYL